MGVFCDKSEGNLWVSCRLKRVKTAFFVQKRSRSLSKNLRTSRKHVTIRVSILGRLGRGLLNG